MFGGEVGIGEGRGEEMRRRVYREVDYGLGISAFVKVI